MARLDQTPSSGLPRRQTVTAPLSRRDLSASTDYPGRRGRFRSAVTILLLAASTLFSCREEAATRGATIVGHAINAHGAAVLANAVMEFDFRGDRYQVHRHRGQFRYERQYLDSLGRVRDILQNDGVYRERDGTSVKIDDTARRSIETTVNSVVYFASLPYPLADMAVRPRWIGSATVDGEPYHKVEITFDREGGGRDYQDRFVYWIHEQTHLIDYLAYYYLTDETGSRFREAVNRRIVNGLWVQDYVNFKAREDTIGSRVELFDELRAAGGLVIVSEVLLENVSLMPLTHEGAVPGSQTDTDSRPSP